MDPGGPKILMGVGVMGKGGGRTSSAGDSTEGQRGMGSVSSTRGEEPPGAVVATTQGTASWARGTEAMAKGSPCSNMRKSSHSATPDLTQNLCALDLNIAYGI